VYGLALVITWDGPYTSHRCNNFKTPIYECYW
jgi:hypothetical protein